jgi:UDP-glucose 4-epimerase
MKRGSTMSILVTGGAGYIGSHTVIELLNAGYEVVVLDNLVNSSKESLKRVEEITGKKVTFYEGDIADRELLKKMFEAENIDSCIHFAGLKAVGESVSKPLEYYSNNISGSLVLFDEMRNHNVKNIIFSSSATVYGDPAFVPITEECPMGEITNPYGRTKAMLEQILTDIQKADPEWNVILLRYFNPIGAHKSGKIGENPNGIPNNLMPYITQVAVGKLKCLGVFGDDYDTPDGTCIRDYIHVCDLADGHVKAVEKLKCNPGIEIYNLGTGKGSSVLDVVKTKIEALGGDIDVKTALGEGSCFSIRLPLTLAIIQALMVELGEEKYAIPLETIQTIEDISVNDIKYVQSKEVINLRGSVIPIVRLDTILEIEPVQKEDDDDDNLTVVIINKGDKQAGLVVDRLIGQQEIVIKSLGKYINNNSKIISGATILGDGEVALILDVNTLV